MAPDPRRTVDAVRQVRLAFPDAVMVHTKRFYGGPEYNIHSHDPKTYANNLWIGSGATPKQAWWKAVPAALAASLKKA